MACSCMAEVPRGTSAMQQQVAIFIKYMLKTIKIVVKGKVQGVFFRKHTQEKAQILGVKGYVKNAFDGSVEVIATGDHSSLKKLIDWVKKGPTMARVDLVEIIALPIVKGFDDFKII